MSSKRSRVAYEADLQAQQSPFVLYGTPLPPLDPEVRDDGSYVPIWQQEVRDERGRKRLHGAFTGGWSAGYFNTVGSKDGWTPSTFISSRSKRHKDDRPAHQQRPEDFMDEEDLADAEESKRIQTSQAFAGLDTADNHVSRTNGLAGLFRVQGETMGTNLLRKMGWKEGQGIGPKVHRKANLDMRTRQSSDDTSDIYLFAPENAPMIGFVRKTDRRGLGYEGESRLTPLASSRLGQPAQSDDEDEDEDGFCLGRPKALSSTGVKNKDGRPRGGIGTGVLNDTGSDDEDPYEIGPKISYNKVLATNKKKKKKDLGSSAPVNPALKSRPVFIPKRTAAVKAALGIRKCHDGRPPLRGFVLGREPDPLISMVNADGRYPPPEIPADWKSSKKPAATSNPSQYVSAADAAKASQLDPSARAALLGEKQLPGKSVFDFLSPAARDRIAAATGRKDLPEAKGEIPEGYALSEEERRRKLLERVPRLDKQSALAALARGASGGGPYADSDDKRSRYRAYLELEAVVRSELPSKPARMTTDEWIQELHEFYNVARIFRPMTGSMASRFTTSSSSSMATGSDGKFGDDSLLSKAPSKPEDPAEAAAKMNMFGPMTRSICEFHPTRLLCKRFNVKPPAHVQLDRDMDTREAQGMRPMQTGAAFQDTLKTGETRDRPEKQDPYTGLQKQEDAVLDTSRNDALEGKRAGEDVFRAIFGDSSDEES